MSHGSIWWQLATTIETLLSFPQEAKNTITNPNTETLVHRRVAVSAVWAKTLTQRAPSEDLGGVAGCCCIPNGACVQRPPKEQSIPSHWRLRLDVGVSLCVGVVGLMVRGTSALIPEFPKEDQRPKAEHRG